MRARLHGSRLARRTTVQPVQLSLMPDRFPAPPAVLIAELPVQQVAAAVALLAHLIAKTAGPDLVAPAGTGAGDE
jgi:hypothetical protein